MLLVACSWPARRRHQDRLALPDYFADALRALTGTYGQLLAECNGRRREVAEEAERLNSEKRTLIESWPFNIKTGE